VRERQRDRETERSYSRFREVNAPMALEMVPLNRLLARYLVGVSEKERDRQTDREKSGERVCV
jgi:hypothetical protein